MKIYNKFQKNLMYYFFLQFIVKETKLILQMFESIKIENYTIAIVIVLVFLLTGIIIWAVRGMSTWNTSATHTFNNTQQNTTT